MPRCSQSDCFCLGTFVLRVNRLLSALQEHWVGSIPSRVNRLRLCGLPIETVLSFGANSGTGKYLIYQPQIRFYRMGTNLRMTQELIKVTH